MKSRDEIIYDMCLTWRHDYGIVKTNPYDTGPGVNDAERVALWKSMSQIYDNVFAPILKEKS